MSGKYRFAAALIFPMLCLAGFVLWNVWVATQGQKLTLPIRGFDPRDLLAGHYLAYRIEYGFESLCTGSKNQHEKKTYICFAPKKILGARPQSSECQKYLKGVCKNGRFQTGLDRFYIPQKHARKLEQAVVNKKGEVILSLDGMGGAAITDLLIDGLSWKKWVSVKD
tara:strand:+ start:220 stop:720 length:501 start_codon:yes stop_codon:yes gene_type:complete